MHVPLIVGKKMFDQVEQPSMPWNPRAYSNKQLQQSVAENWSDEIAAFRTFAITRVGRHFTRFTLGSVGVGIYQATNVKWIRYTIKGIARFAPVIGWGLLAYDLYHLGEDLDIY